MKRGITKPRETTSKGDINHIRDEISGIMASFSYRETSKETR